MTDEKKPCLTGVSDCPIEHCHNKAIEHLEHLISDLKEGRTVIFNDDCIKDEVQVYPTEHEKLDELYKRVEILEKQPNDIQSSKPVENNGINTWQDSDIILVEFAEERCQIRGNTKFSSKYKAGFAGSFDFARYDKEPRRDILRSWLVLRK